MAEDPAFRARWARSQAEQQASPCSETRPTHRLSIDPATMFDIQVKRFHEVQAQTPQRASILSLYHRLKRNEHLDAVPRTAFFGGEAAPAIMRPSSLSA